uniref:Putative secreted protein n=1 Tax=Amblyomma tuberculatum TaxID=48802 RepID=A0A6M2E157_9ACAR
MFVFLLSFCSHQVALNVANPLTTSNCSPHLRVLLLMMMRMPGNVKLMTSNQSRFASPCCGERVRRLTRAPPEDGACQHSPAEGASPMMEEQEKQEEMLPSLLL